MENFARLKMHRDLIKNRTNILKVDNKKVVITLND